MCAANSKIIIIRQLDLLLFIRCTVKPPFWENYLLCMSFSTKPFANEFLCCNLILNETECCVWSVGNQMCVFDGWVNVCLGYEVISITMAVTFNTKMKSIGRACYLVFTKSVLRDNTGSDLDVDCYVLLKLSACTALFIRLIQFE